MAKKNQERELKKGEKKFRRSLLKKKKRKYLKYIYIYDK